jgi:hypothetical protein
MAQASAAEAAATIIPESELQRRREAKAIVKRALSTLAAVGAQPAPACPHCGRIWIRRRDA